MTDCPQSEKCAHWIRVKWDWEMIYECEKGWILECDEVQESRCPDFEKVEEERE